MWGKLEQAFIWIISYLPVLLIALYRYFFEKEVSKLSLSLYGHQVSNDIIHVVSIVVLMTISALLYYFVPTKMFKKIERQLSSKKKGQTVIIKKFERPTLNDYTFFLLTLILPIITVDFSSTVSLLVCFLVITFSIILLTRVDYIIACPLFFVSSYKVWKVSILETSEKDESYTINGYIITKENDFFNKEFRVSKLIRNVYFLI
ncbi:hypothetical protein ACLM5H_15725 [Fredinandcohnia humi]